MKKIKFLALSAFAALALILAGCDNGASLDDDSGTDTTQISDSGNTEKESSGDEKTDTTTNEVESPAATYTITISDKITHGSVSISKLTDLKADDTVTITITPDTDYLLDTLIVKDASGNTVTTTDNTFKMPAGNVTVTATFKWKYPYLGNKASTEAKEVGDIVFNDGSAIAYSSELLLTDEQKEAAIAVIFYVGTGSATIGSNENILGEKTLGVGLNTADGLIWAPYNTTGNSTDFIDIQSSVEKSEPNGKIYYKTMDWGENVYYPLYISGDFDGSDNWSVICSVDSTGSEDAETNYPAFNWANKYGEIFSIPENYKNGWYIPTITELFILRSNITAVNNALATVGKTKFDNVFWSSNQCARDLSKYNVQAANYSEILFVSESSNT